MITKNMDLQSDFLIYSVSDGCLYDKCVLETEKK